jgi:hypothetical protein
MINIKDNTIILRELFEHYKQKYNLNTKLSFYCNYGSCYSVNLDKINIDYDYIQSVYNKNNTKLRHSYKSFIELAGCVLLHEIKHAIDYKLTPTQFIDEVNYIEQYPNLNKLDYPLEQRADEFANIEIEQWKPYIC